MRNQISRKGFLIIILLNIIQFSIGQGNNRIIPPVPLSPEAALLHQFVDIPVGYFTGTPEINIPIYEINLSTIKIPISIEYHSAGLKVDQMATSVGWGWSLQAGGSISYNQVGLEDFGSGGYVSYLQDIENLTYEDKVQITGSQGQNSAVLLDVQPDIYYYSYPGGSGRFIYDMNGNARIIPHKPLRIVKNNSFSIIDPKGNKFEFNLRSDAINANADPGIYNNSADYYLTKITTPTGEIVNYEYDYEAYQTYYTLNIRRFQKTQQNCTYVGQYPPSEDNPVIDQTVGVYRVKKISSNYGHRIEFEYNSTPREDCNSFSQYPCKSLRRIKVFYGNSQIPAKEVEFFNSYFLSFNNSSLAYKNKRLKLDSLNVIGKGTYNFEYYFPGNTTYLHSFSQDLYGYNNGRSNSTLIPNIPGIFSGANRTQQLDYLVAGTLKSLKYPTGGKTEFNYELNLDSLGEYVGGVRVNSIKELENNTLIKERYFQYEDIVVSPKPVFDQDITFYISQISPQACNHCPKVYIETRSHTSTGQNGINGGGVGYTKVSELFGPEGSGGKIVYTFNGQRVTGNAGLWPFAPEHDNGGTNGLLLSKTVFSRDQSSFYLVSSEKFHYDLKLIGDYIKSATIPVLYPECVQEYPPPCPCWVNTSAAFGNTIYNTIGSYSINEISVENRVYKPYTPANYIDSSRHYISTKKEMNYNSPFHPFVTRELFKDSQGLISKKDFKYPLDYQIYTGSKDQMVAALQHMKDSNIIDIPIEVIEMYNSKVINGSILLYKIDGYQHVVPTEALEMELISPVDSSSILRSYVNSSNQFIKSSELKQNIIYDKFNSYGKILQYHSNNNVSKSFSWGYSDLYVITEAVNTNNDDIFYTSFEESGGNSNSGDSYSGRYSKTNGFSQALSNLNNSQYIHSYQKKVNSIWELMIDTVSVSNGTYSINISGQVDEVRFYPISAQMTTYTYEPLIGMTSNTDQNNITTYYEYDSFGRLEYIRDNKKNILKHIEYHYRIPNEY